MSRFGLAGQYGRWASSSSAPPVGAVIPADSLIMYNGTDPGLSDWARYTTADGYYLKGTTTQGSIGTTAAATASGSVIVTLTSAGTHTGTANLNYTTGPNAGSVLPGQQNTAGSHTHSFVKSSISNSIRPYNTSITLLRATTDLTSFPSGTIHISPTNSGGWTEKLASTSTRYLQGGNGVTDGNPITTSVGGTSTTGGSHSHTTANRGTGGTTNPPQGIYKLGSTQGSHTHTISSILTVSSIRSKLLKLWLTASASIITTDLVLMYVGTLSSLPSNWKLCDGTNGTIDMTDYFLGYSNSSVTAWDTSTALSGSLSGTTISTNAWSHYHYSSDSTAASRYELFAHNTQSASHTHGAGANLTSFDYSPPAISVAFIQYKG
jgi:hypothetical protein